jgi:hypothetical protein
MEKIINWWLAKRLKWRKRRLLHEVLLDLKFIEVHRGDQLRADDSLLRAQLAGEKRKHEPNERAIARLEAQVANSQATKREYERLKAVAEEMPLYIEML